MIYPERPEEMQQHRYVIGVTFTTVSLHYITDVVSTIILINMDPLTATKPINQETNNNCIIDTMSIKLNYIVFSILYFIHIDTAPCRRGERKCRLYLPAEG